MTEGDIIDKIHAYWRNQGYAVRVAMREYDARGPSGSKYTLYGVRSDLVNGLPKGYYGELARVVK